MSSPLQRPSLQSGGPNSINCKVAPCSLYSGNKETLVASLDASSARGQRFSQALLRPKYHVNDDSRALDVLFRCLR